MNLETWIQNLIKSHHKQHPNSSSSSRENHLREHESWYKFIDLCDQYTLTFNRFSKEKITFHHLGSECQLSLNRSQLSFQLLTGMIRARLTRVEGYNVEQLLDHHLLSDHDGFGGVYWKLEHRVFSEDMLLRMTLEALVSTYQHPLYKAQKHEYHIPNSRT
ncbi:MAG: hypothetical protein AB8C84_05665 [Oligoflexales bacterium]